MRFVSLAVVPDQPFYRSALRSFLRRLLPASVDAGGGALPSSILVASRSKTGTGTQEAEDAQDTYRVL